MKLISLVIGLFFALTAAVYAGESDHVIERGFLKNIDPSVTVEEVATKEFQPFTDALALGHVETTSWVKLRVRPNTDGGHLTMRIRPTFLDQVTLYTPDPQRPGAWIKQTSGDTVPWLKRPCPELGICFTVQPTQESTYYLRMQTLGTSLLTVDVLTHRDAVLDEFELGAAFVLYLLIMSWILVWAVFDYWSQRHAVVGWFVLSQAAFILYSLMIMGYGASVLPALATDDLTNVVIVIAVTTNVVFHHQFLTPFHPPRQLLDSLKIMVVINLGVLVAILLGTRSQTLLRVDALIMFASGLVVLPAAMMARKDDVLSRSALRLPYALKTLVVMASLTPVLWGEDQSSEFSLTGPLVIGLASAGLMAYLLFKRSLSFREAQSNLEFQKKRWEEQSLVLSMLSHELKTPLSVLRNVIVMKESAPELIEMGVTSIQEMDNIIEKSNEAIRLESGTLQLHVVECDIEQILHDIVHLIDSAKRVQLHVNDSMVVETDGALLRVVILNLIDNALKYGDPSRPVEVFLERASEQGGAMVTVSNYAGSVGWPDSETLFKKYQRGSKAHRVSGSGLGLYLAQGFAGLIGAQLKYRPLDQQVRFSLYLPSTLPITSSANRPPQGDKTWP